MSEPSLGPVGDWIDERTGWRAFLRAWLVGSVPGGAPIGRVLTAAVATCVAILALTGVVLMTAYAPSPQTAWASVHYVQFVQTHGWIIRGLHYWAAQTLFVVAALHILYGALTAAHRPAREITWWLTLAVFGLALGAGITGGLLSWDQRGWWARVVEGNIVGLAPVIGGWLSQIVAGGPELGALGLSRAYAVHVAVLPLLLGAALWGRRALTQRYESAEGTDQRALLPKPVAAARSVVVAVIVALALFAMTGFAHGGPLDAPADPLSDYPARPEWFLLTLFQLRKLFHGPLEFWGTTLVPGLAAGYFAVLPWIDRRPGRRAVAIVPVLAIFAGAAVLALVAIRHDAADPQYVKARAKWDDRAAAAAHIAMNGVPPAGALEMMRHDPEVRGEDLFERHCASCHVLGGLGDPKKATATNLSGWGTSPWIEAMIHDPDGADFFGRGPYKEHMPSVDVRPKDQSADEPWQPMIKTPEERHAVALFLSIQGDEPGDPPRALDAKTRTELERAEKVVSNRCTSCHLYKGEGDDEGDALAPELSGYGSVAWTRAQIENPASPHTYRSKALDGQLKKHMPRFDKDLSAADIDIVARFTRSHARAESLPH